MKEHQYQIGIKWTGNNGSGTSSYTSYSRNHIISGINKPDFEASSDPAFRGDANRYNPEELLLAALSSCHMLWYLHLCADAGIIVTSYTDQASGKMQEFSNSGKFTEVTLRPEITIEDPELADKAMALHDEANKRCFIANSCNFPVFHLPSYKMISK